VGTKQEMYRLMRELAQTGIAILFYSTDYEELIGMCDRVVVCYGGKLIRELKGTDLNEHNLITAALNLSEEFVRSGSSGVISETAGGSHSKWMAFRRFWRWNVGPLTAFLVFAIMFLLF